MSEPAPDRALGRRRHGLVDAAPDQVEERRRELVASPASPPCRSSVGTSGGLGVGRRLLLVLAVVAGSAARGRRNQKTAAMTRSAGMVARPSTTRPVRIGCAFSASMRSWSRCVALRRRRALLGTIRSKAFAALDAHPGGRRERGARDQRAQLDELVRRDVDRAERRAACRRARRRRAPTRACPTRAGSSRGASRIPTRRREARPTGRPTP